MGDDKTNEIDAEIIDCDIDCVVRTLKKHLLDGKQIVDILNKVKNLCKDWQCGACETVKYTDMIECDQCLSWFHWTCVSEEGTVPVSMAVWSCSTCVK